MWLVKILTDVRIKKLVRVISKRKTCMVNTDNNVRSGPLSWQVHIQFSCHVNEFLVRYSKLYYKVHWFKSLQKGGDSLASTICYMVIKNLSWIASWHSLKKPSFQTILPSFHRPHRHQLPSKLIGNDKHSQFENLCSFVWIITNKSILWVHSRRLDGNASLLFIFPGISKSCFSSFLGCNNPSFTDQGIS